ncbi:growth-blocking peptide, long form-like [Bombyx mandarina]|uniref:Growth-blocking peptide, long form-like n=1 Tax=Bombyx mandarina TaxID=7092 RepID=A0A6J2K7M8_BOMMA|nr:growth-blocking peptide, long form-like [Bombyx mandarina]
MKCSVFILCCAVLILNDAGPVNAGVNGFVNNLRRGISQAEQDLSDRLIFRDDDNDQYNYNNAVNRPVYPTESGVSGSVQRGVVEFVTQPTIVPTPTSAGKTTTEKEGRENFVGGCATGFKRTADGRCKPTF